MNAFTTKKTTAGVAAIAAAGLLAVGVAMPATADTTSVDSSTSERSSTTDTATNILDSIEAVLNGGDITGGITGGDLSNESPVVIAPQTGDIVSDVVDVNGLVEDITGSVDVDGIISDVTGSLTGILGR